MHALSCSGHLTERCSPRTHSPSLCIHSSFRCARSRAPGLPPAHKSKIRSPWRTQVSSRRGNDTSRREPEVVSTLSTLQQAQAAKLLAPLCVVPPQAQAEVRLSVRFEGPAAILLESRPRFQDPSEWGEHPIAKFRYVKGSRTWRLFCQHRDLQWHTYAPLPESLDLATLVAEVREDPTGIFWG